MGEKAKDYMVCLVCGRMLLESNPRMLKVYIGKVERAPETIYFCSYCAQDIKLALAEKDKGK